jgi:hypothetical protein
MFTRASQRIALVLASIAILVISACSGSASPGASSAPAGTSAPAGASAWTGSDAVCADAAAVKSSVAALKDLDLTAVGTNGLSAAVTAIETAVTGLSNSAGTTATAEREALKTSLASLKTAVSGLTSDASVKEKATELRTAIAGVETAATALQAAMPGCGG